jgi:hypothetical protein
MGPSLTASFSCLEKIISPQMWFQSLRRCEKKTVNFVPKDSNDNEDSEGSAADDAPLNTFFTTRC